MAETPPSDENVPRYPDDLVDPIVGSRAAIEQAKGILMFVFAIDAHRALQMISSQARTAQVQLCLLAQQFVDDVTTLTADERGDMPLTCNRLLLTAHERIRRTPQAGA